PPPSGSMPPPRSNTTREAGSCAWFWATCSPPLRRAGGFSPPTTCEAASGELRGEDRRRCRRRRTRRRFHGHGHEVHTGRVGGKDGRDRAGGRRETAGRRRRVPVERPDLVHLARAGVGGPGPPQNEPGPPWRVGHRELRTSRRAREA